MAKRIVILGAGESGAGAAVLAKKHNTFLLIDIGINSVGGWSEGGTPSPIPNLAVKPFSADGSSRATVRKSRPLPTEFFNCQPKGSYL